MNKDFGIQSVAILTPDYSIIQALVPSLIKRLLFDHNIWFSIPMSLDHESLDLVLQSSNLVHQITGLVGGDACSDNCSANTTSSAQSCLRWDIDVWAVLVLRQKWEMEKDGEGGGVGSEDDDLADSAVKSLGRLVGAFLQLAVVGCLLNKIEDLLCKSCVGNGPGGRAVLFFGHLD